MGLIRAEQIDVGTGPNQVLVLDDQGKLPVLDTSQLSNLPFPWNLEFRGVLVSDPVDVVPSGATETIVSWNNEESDSSNTFDINNPSRLAVPTGSWAQINARISFQADSGGVRRARIMKNGAEFIGNGDITIIAMLNSANTEIVLVTPFVPVQNGDYFELRVSQTSGNDLTLDISSYFGMTILG